MDTTYYNDFLLLRDPGSGFLTVHTPDNQAFTFSGLDLDYILHICPLLAFSFEDGSRGRKLHSMNVSSLELISRFLRFLYTGSYAVLGNTGHEVPCSLFMHAQLYYYGELYDVPLLMDSAYFSVSEICELACSMPTAPAGLCETLRYLYQNVKGSHEIHDTIMHYCMNCLLYHHLGEDDDFKRLLVDVKPFQQDLFRINMERGFQDDGSSYIIQMQLPSNSRREEFNFDYLYEMFGSANSTPMHTPLLSPSAPSPTPGFTLVHRPRELGGVPGTEDSDGYSSDGSQWSDLESFSLVGRPRSNVNWFEELRRQREVSRSPSPSEFAHGSTHSGDTSRSQLRSNNPFRGDKNFDRFPAPYVQPQNPFRTGSEPPSPLTYTEHSTSSIGQNGLPFTPLGGFGQPTRSEENKVVTSPFDDPSDADESDSDWSVVGDQPSPHKAVKATDLPIRNRSLYAREDLAGSAETIVAISDRDDSASEQIPHATDGESSDSEWSICSDDAGVPAPS